jgi:hypothetical protein
VWFKAQNVTRLHRLCSGFGIGKEVLVIENKNVLFHNVMNKRMNDVTLA